MKTRTKTILASIIIGASVGLIVIFAMSISWNNGYSSCQLEHIQEGLESIGDSLNSTLESTERMIEGTEELIETMDGILEDAEVILEEIER